MVTLAEGRQALAAAWRAQNPDTPEAVAAFYRETDALADDLAAFHAHPQRQAWTEALVTIAREAGVGSVLDVGCGRGDDLRALADAGVPVLFGVEPNESLRLVTTAAICLSDATGVTSLVTDSLTDDAITAAAPFDLTILIDVLEHIPDPAAFLDRVLEHVPVGGLVAEHTPTWDIANPTHLRANWGWSPGHQLRRNGCTLTHDLDGLRVWKRLGPAAQVPATLAIAAYRTVEAHLLRAFGQLKDTGHWNLILETNDALVQRARSMIVSKWWREDHADVFLMVDADIVFDPRDAERIVDRCRTGYPVICGAYPVRGATHLSSRLTPGEPVVFSADAAPVAIDLAATGFLCVHRDVIDALIPTLPLCNAETPWSFWPFFDTSIVEHPNGNAELYSEDWAFSKRCRDAGFPIWLDPSIRLGHIGTYEWRLEDLQREPRRYRPVVALEERWNAGAERDA